MGMDGVYLDVWTVKVDEIFWRHFFDIQDHCYNFLEKKNRNFLFLQLFIAFFEQ